MNIEISVLVPVPEGAASYVTETEVQRITDPTTVRALLLTIIACEAATAAAEAADRAAGFTTLPDFGRTPADASD